MVTTLEPVGEEAVSLVVVELAATVKVKVQLPVDPRESVTVPVATFDPAASVLGATMAPDVLTVTLGDPVDWAYV